MQQARHGLAVAHGVFHATQGGVLLGADRTVGLVADEFHARPPGAARLNRGGDPAKRVARKRRDGLSIR